MGALMSGVLKKVRHRAFWQGTFVCLLFNSLLYSCSAPVKRQSNEVVMESPVLSEKPAHGQLPDLKKRIWVLGFEEQVERPKALKRTQVSEVIKQEIRREFNSEKSPFITQTDDDEKAFVGLQIEELGEPTEIARRLRGSDVAGFILGRITQLEVKGVGEDSPGILRSRTLAFYVGVEYDVYDTNTGRKVASGRETQSYIETRSDFMGVTATIPELPKRLLELSKSLGTKMLSRLTPVSEKLAWGGRVLRIEGGRLYVNAGRVTGLMVGDVLKVIEAPREIQDPNSGSFIGTAPGRMKGTVKVIQYFGNDGAIAVLQSGGGIFPGDRVELY